MSKSLLSLSICFCSASCSEGYKFLDGDIVPTEMRQKIKSVLVREILDSRGNPTVEVDVVLESGAVSRAASPSGASTGKLEAVELRDGGERYGGKGVVSAVELIRREVGPLLIGKDPVDQEQIDSEIIDLDGTNKKARLGGNGIIAVSMAVARAGALATGKPLWEYLGRKKARLLPVPMMNILNGGVHANWEGPDFQEYMIVPCGARDFREGLRWGAETYHALKSVLKRNGYNTAVGDEGGFVARVSSNEIPLEMIVKAIEEAGYVPGRDIGIALDPAASAFHHEGEYILSCEKLMPGGSERRSDSSGGAVLASGDMIDYYSNLLVKYPIVSIEDGLSEDDWDGWRELNRKLGGKIELVGDDIFVTDAVLIKKGIEERIANATLIKPNQIGTVTETVNAIRVAKEACWGVEVSHRSGETTDSFIADLAVGMETGHIKTGAPCRGERVEKYNQLLRIEEQLGSKAEYAGRAAFSSNQKEP